MKFVCAHYTAEGYETKMFWGNESKRMLDNVSVGRKRFNY